MTSGGCLLSTPVTPPGSSSPYQEYELYLGSDGNLTLYFVASSDVLWDSGTSGNPGATATMQADGNLVVSSAAGASLWTSNTSGNPGATATAQTDGNFVVSSAAGAAAWTSGTSGVRGAHLYPGASLAVGQTLQSSFSTHNGPYVFVMQGDGNLVLYSRKYSQPLWASNTPGNPGAIAVMQTDGNFVVYSATGTPLWASGTNGHGGAGLVVQADGNVVIYSSVGSANARLSGRTVRSGPIVHLANTSITQALWATGSSQPVYIGSSLAAGQQLTSGQYLQSPNGQYELDMFPSGAAVAWSNPSYPCMSWLFPAPAQPNDVDIQLPALVAGSYMAMQADGNLVLYSATGTAIWASNTSDDGKTAWAGPISLQLQDDGNLVVYNGGSGLWADAANNWLGPMLCPGMTLTGLAQRMETFPDMSGTPTGFTSLTKAIGFAYDGNGPKWELDYFNDGAQGSHIVKGLQANSSLDMQTDGNLVIYPPGGGSAEWASNTDGNPGAYALLEFNPAVGYFTLFVMPPPVPSSTSEVTPLGVPQSASHIYSIPSPQFYTKEYLGGHCFDCSQKGPYQS